MINRRDFLKWSAASAAATVGLKGMSQSNNQASALDDVVLEVETNPEDVDTRQLRDHSVIYFLAGLTASGYTHDSTGDGTNWELVKTSDNLVPFNPGMSSNILYTGETLTDDIAEQDVTLTYRALDENHPSSGPYATVNDEIDRYQTNFTITYKANGEQKVLTFAAPNSVTKKIFGWDPGEAIEYIPTVSYNRNDNPAEFQNAFTNLSDVLTDPDYAVKNSRLTNRNTPSPCPDPNPWYGDAAVLEALAADPMTVDDLYPTVIKVDMVDFKKYGKLAPEEKEKVDAKYFNKAIVTGAGMAGAKKLVDNIKNAKMPQPIITL